MTSFPLKVVTPDGLIFDGNAEKVIVRATTGDIGFLAGHINCVGALGMGRAVIETDGKRRSGACIGGMFSFMNGALTLVPTTFEWAENIDLDRVEKSILRAKTKLDSKNCTNDELRLAEARLSRALVRKSVATTR